VVAVIQEAIEIRIKGEKEKGDREREKKEEKK